MSGFCLAQESLPHHFPTANDSCRYSCRESSDSVFLNRKIQSLAISSSLSSNTYRSILKPVSCTFRKKHTSIWDQGVLLLTFHNVRVRCACALQAEARAPTSRCYYKTSSPSHPSQYNSEAVNDSGEDGEDQERASIPAERAKWRRAVDRGLKSEPAENRQPSDVLDPAGLSLETETAFLGQEEDTTRGSSVDHSSSESIKVDIPKA